MEEDDADRSDLNLPLDLGPHAAAVFGQYDVNLRLIEESLGISVINKGKGFHVIGSESAVQNAQVLFQELSKLAAQGIPITHHDVEHLIGCFTNHSQDSIRGVLSDTILVTSGNKKIIPKSPMQKAYIDAIRAFDLVFAIGPAGTGKTYLAMAMAVAALLSKQVMRIVLARPAVEAGESLGFLPGNMYEKVNPYLRPLYDALYDMLTIEKANRLVERGLIEIAPIAFMRGRTLNDSFIILDEAQNTTAEQMKMFLTRLGYNSQAVITGDVTQIDLPSNKTSGLVQAEVILRQTKGIKFIYFTEVDVVRHNLVQKIIRAYEQYEQRRRAPKLTSSHPEQPDSPVQSQGTETIPSHGS